MFHRGGDSCSSLWCAQTGGWVMAEELRVAIVVPPEDLIDVSASSANHGVEQEPIDEATGEQLEIGILAAVLLIGAGLALAKVVADLWERWRGGLEIDLTKKPIKIARNHEIPMGYIVTVTKDGKVDVK